MKPPQKLRDLNKDEYEKIIKRSRAKIEEVLDEVIPIIRKVRKYGDEAVLNFTEKFDKVRLSSQDLVVGRERVAEAYRRVPSNVLSSLKRMYKQVKNFHQYQLRQDWELTCSFAGKDKYRLGERFVPVQRAGVYVPGGKAVYPSTAIMAIVPAKVAGVEKVVVVSPPTRSGMMADAVIVAADIAGADLMINAGGVQAIAALAYGTKSIPKVDIVVGPGNVYVTAAKTYLSSIGEIAIDCPAGPSEVLILADDSANPAYVVSDMVAQAEHDEDACCMLLTTSEKLAQQVHRCLDIEVEQSLRKDIIRKSLESYGAILIADSLSEAVSFANEFAPEHLEIMTSRPEDVLKKIKNAGSIFLGNFSPVAAGDYMSGTNHILPTGGSARGFSGLSVDTFLKRLTYQFLSQKTLNSMNEDIANLSSVEGPYEAHMRSVRKRRE